MLKVKWPMVTIMGILTMINAWIGILSALALYPSSFSPLNNYISDLGHYGNNPIGAWIFNINLIVGAIIFLLFYIGMSEYKPTRNSDKMLLKSIQILGGIYVFCAIMVALISEDFWIAHTIWSIILFSIAFIISLLGAFFLYRQPTAKRIVVVYGFIAACCHILLLFILPFGLKIFEWVIAIIGQINVLLVALNYKHMINIQSQQSRS
jgi:hypothetical membrane protein